ncbi:MAG: hypothetical protein WCJ81_03280 [bacterium]
MFESIVSHFNAGNITLGFTADFTRDFVFFFATGAAFIGATSCFTKLGAMTSADNVKLDQTAGDCAQFEIIAASVQSFETDIHNAAALNTPTIATLATCAFTKVCK